MKKSLILFSIILFTILNSCVTSYYYGGDSISYSRLVKVEGKTKKQIYASLKEWIADNYISPKTVMHDSDKDIGLITMRTSMYYLPIDRMHVFFEGTISFNIKIIIQDEKFIITLSHFKHKQLPYRYITTADKYIESGPNAERLNHDWVAMKLTLQDYSMQLLNKLSRYDYSKFENW